MSTSTLYLLEPAIRGYAWGSRTVLAELRGRPAPTPEPEAELWFGAHPSAPADVQPGTSSLLELIDHDPAAVLGADVAHRFDGRLPFLVKLLAADQPLSLQAHPSEEQARAGFAREESTGPDRDAPTRLYRDAWPKPELLHALTPVSALCGFREPEATVELLDALDVAPLRAMRDALARDGQAAFPALLEDALHEHGWTAADDAALAAATGRLSATPGRFCREAEWFARLLRRYPGDGGVRVALLLRLVELAPGQAMHLPGGNLHAYLHGAGVEVMASSDNVVRGGLTVKHVDVDELLRIVEPRVLPPPVVTPVPTPVGGGVATTLPTPTTFFAVQHLDLAPDDVIALDRGRGGPEILVAVDGEVELASATDVVRLGSGQGAFVTAAATELRVTGTGQLFRTTVG